jgi:hypothetical protein
MAAMKKRATETHKDLEAIETHKRLLRKLKRARYVAKNRLKIKKQKAANRLKNKEHNKALQRLWVLNNRVRYMAYRRDYLQKWRAARKLIESKIVPQVERYEDLL